MSWIKYFIGIVALLLAAAPPHLFAQTAPSPTSSPTTQPASQGLLPIPDYSGDLFTRSYLAGDLWGFRTDLANKGIQFDVDWTQFLQSDVDGGRNTGTDYGANLNYLFYFDLMRMGLLPGALVTVRAETRYGTSVNGITGSILPVNTSALFPLTQQANEVVPIAVTDLNYTQFLSEQFAVLVGKIDTLSGDPNEFASGRGTTQFMNANFIFNATLGLRLPYSTLGAGVVWLPTPNIKVSSIVMNTADSSTTAGFTDFGDGTTWTTEADFQYRLGQLPGGMNVGGLYSFDQDFNQLSGELIFVPGQGLVIPKNSDTWAVYWSAWQYLLIKDPSNQPIDLSTGTQSHEGLGLFARVGFADQSTNPVKWSLSAGIGGKGMIPTRNQDTFGVGYFYTSIEQSRLFNVAGIQPETQGGELFYNIAVTPAAHLTLDMQVVDSPFSNINPAILLGMRLDLNF
jgi:porin